MRLPHMCPWWSVKATSISLRSPAASASAERRIRSLCRVDDRHRSSIANVAATFGRGSRRQSIGTLSRVNRLPGPGCAPTSASWVPARRAACSPRASRSAADRTVCLVEAGPDYGPHDAGRWPADLLDASRLRDLARLGLRRRRRLPRGRRLLGAQRLPRRARHAGRLRRVGGGDRATPAGAGRRWSRCWRAPRPRSRRAGSRRTRWASFTRAALDGLGGAGRAGAGRLQRRRRRPRRRPAAGEPARPHALERGLRLPRSGPRPARADGAGGRARRPRRGRGRPGARRSSCSTGAGAGLVEAATVVLAAGAYGSPPVLLRSGIGPADELRALGIDVVADVPGVGRDAGRPPRACTCA